MMTASDECSVSADMCNHVHSFSCQQSLRQQQNWYLNNATINALRLWGLCGLWGDCVCVGWGMCYLWSDGACAGGDYYSSDSCSVGHLEHILSPF